MTLDRPAGWAPVRVLLSSHGASLFGAERVLLALSAGLAGRGHSVTIELPHAGPALDAAHALQDVEVVVSNRVRLPRNAGELLRFSVRSPAAVHTLRQMLRRRSPDVVWVNSMYNAHAALAARAARLPVIWHLHERNFPGAAGAVMCRVVAACSHMAIAPSAFVAASFTGRGTRGPDVRVIDNALLTRVEPLPLRAPDSGPFLVGFVGQLEPRKRPVDVIAAVAGMPGAAAILVGDGKHRAAVQAVIERLAVSGRVRISGFQHDVRSSLSNCDCVVIPSREEPFGLVALEAMALGIPVVAADSGALPAVLGDAAIYYPLGDVPALIGQLQRVRGDRTLRMDLRRRGLERVAHFSLERMIDGAESVLMELVRRQAGQQ